ncbi:phosphopyruvate hydratase [Edhazardia aedis USNM 41457]|uniref:phosphopyruvate hydratase n=1 Tax=Edhazardia aedis (strain USNM 41457) TaxID=1003232 RepID=J9D056_EDHAE|nr:phosphopyruvate hydratase [Edhazardia aedis USNM 41457]|eukprot:EJW01251.1 phosphopyruvate hydratase [Edhazardia aedis USNM 41457]
MKEQKIGEVFNKLFALQILSSRGEPTVEVEMHTKIGVLRASCPSGASTGKKEAKVICNKNTEKYGGKTVEEAISNIEKIIASKISDLSSTKVTEQFEIDKFLLNLDGTLDKNKIGANAILPISMAFCRLGSLSMNMKLYNFIANISKSRPKMPIPYFNVINGGVHCGNMLPFQEIMISFHSMNYEENLERAVSFYHDLKKVITKKYGLSATCVGDEGGFGPPIQSLEQGLDLIKETICFNEKYQGIKVAIDCAANELFSNGFYSLDFKKKEQKIKLTSYELIQYYIEILKCYPFLHMIEDPFHESDIQAWKIFSDKIKNMNINVTGDDLTVTNKVYVKIACSEKLCNTLLVKLNQIGTVYEAIEAMCLARSNGMKIMVSHRSGETEDTFISDFAVGIGADYIKAGAPCRGERVAKYNQLLRIYHDLKLKNN